MSDALRKRLSWLTLLTSISFIAYGAFRGEVQTVLSKAVRICLECIGIG